MAIGETTFTLAEIRKMYNDTKKKGSFHAYVRKHFLPSGTSDAKGNPLYMES